MFVLPKCQPKVQKEWLSKMLFYNEHGVKITTHVQERLILDVIRRIVLSIKIDDIQNNDYQKQTFP